MHRSKNSAVAVVKGGKDYPRLMGKVYFNQTPQGVLVTAQVSGLPVQNGACPGVGGVFGFHIHTGEACTGTETNEFADALGHYNPNGCPHPYHAGDLPPLFSNNGSAYMSVLTNRFTLKEILGKVVIIHGKPDDFTTQPSGNAGEMIACGKIVQ